MIENQTKYTSTWLKKFKGLEALTDEDANNAIAQLQELKTIMLCFDAEQEQEPKQKIFSITQTFQQVA
jgi:hypothetical protein